MGELGTREFFAAANSYDGFISYYDGIFNTLSFEHLYIIKGGSGTGKSYLMKKLAMLLEGRGVDIEYFYCSSDPTSLDGAIFTHNGVRVGILDGTAPHTRCTSYPGVIDEIINLGAFWNERKLRHKRDEIIELTQKKRECFNTAYSYLRVAKEASSAKENILRECINYDKMRSQIQRMLKGLKREENPSVSTRLISARSMMGSYRFSSIERLSSEVIYITDDFSSARFYLREIADYINKFGQSYIYVPAPESEKICEGIYLSASKKAILTKPHNAQHNDGTKIINVKRFLRQNKLALVKSDLRMLEGEKRRFESACAETLRRAGEIHFQLENLYSAAMDFDKKDKYTEEIYEKILSQLGVK